MSALYGRLWGSRGAVTRTGHTSITARLEDWENAVQLTLFKDGSYVVEVGEKHGQGEEHYRGNAHSETSR